MYSSGPLPTFYYQCAMNIEHCYVSNSVCSYCATSAYSKQYSNSNLPLNMKRLDVAMFKHLLFKHTLKIFLFLSCYDNPSNSLPSR